MTIQYYRFRKCNHLKGIKGISSLFDPRYFYIAELSDSIPTQLGLRLYLANCTAKPSLPSQIHRTPLNSRRARAFNNEFQNSRLMRPDIYTPKSRSEDAQVFTPLGGVRPGLICRRSGVPEIEDPVGPTGRGEL